MENKYQEGATVVAREDSNRSLHVGRYTKRNYYCPDPASPLDKDLAYYEHELMYNETEAKHI